MKLILLFFILLGLFARVEGQPSFQPAENILAAPVNDDPCTAVTLTVQASCNYATHTNIDATSTAGVPAPACASYGGEDVWFQSTVPSGGALIVSTEAGDITDGGMSIYSGTCTSLTEIACNDDHVASGLMPTITLSGLTPGTTVWIRVWAYGGSVTGNFGICVTTPPPPPANDDPCNAIVLTVGATCNYLTYTNVAALAGSTIPAPSCGYFNDAGDVWFQVTVPAGGALVFDTQAGSMTNSEIAIYTGICNNLTEIACNADGSLNPQMGMITAGGLTPGSIVWIRVWDYGGFLPGTFGICVTPPPPPPANDNPCGAVPLTVNSTCTYSTHTNTGATNTVSIPDPLCGAFAGADVWFTVTVPAGGGIFLNSTAGAMLDGAMAVYSGTSCSNLTLIRCDDNSSTNTGMPQVNLAGLTAGQILWIRFWGYGGFYGGTFGICAAVPPPPTEQDCPAAIPICQNVYSTTVSYSGTGNILNEIDASSSCLGSGEKNDVWYTFTVQTSGDLNFTITPNNFSEDYDWAVYNLTNATCVDIFSNSAIDVSCNFSATGGNTGPTGGTALTNQDASGTPINDVIPVVAGETYVINVSNFSSSANGYTIDFSASTASIFDNVRPVFQSISAASACGGSQLTVNFSENILCSTVQNADFMVTGPGGPYTVTNWSSASCSSGATYGNNITLTLSPAITTNGAFQVCLTNASGSVTDLCGNVALPGCFNFNISTTVPSFNPVGPICVPAGPAIVLPGISLNGVSGTWLPATVDQTATGTYTFTPSAGQCAVPVTITVLVSAGITPIFDPVPLICSGSPAPLLPLTSLNGINGTWNPPVISNTSSGNYVFTPAAGECGVPITIAVTVNLVLTSTTNTTLCNDQLPYSWNGNNYTGTGIYQATLTSNSGCDSVATLNLTVNNTVTSLTNITVCDNQLPYTWNGNSYPIAGTYSVTLLSNSGCDSVATLNLVTNAAVTSTTDITICSNQLPYSWNGNSYPSTGTYSVTLIGSAGCDSIATLNLAANSVVTSITDITICNNQLPYNWNGNNYPAAGTYSVTLISSAGCDSIATLNLTANSVVTSITDITICNNQLPYNWNGNNYPAAGTYSVTLISSAGCDSIATLNLAANLVVTSITDITICNNQLPYNWNGNNYPAAGTYSVTLISSAGCDSIATLNLTANSVVTSITDITICDNQLPYNWNGNNYPAAGTYSVTLISSEGCDSIATLNLAANSVVTSITDITICNNQLPYNWNGNNYPAAGIYSVTLISSAGCDSIATLNLAANLVVTSITDITICNNQLPYNWNGNNYPAAGTYSVTLIGSAGCDSIATLNLAANLVVTSITDITICNNQLPYNWNGNNYPAAGTYSVTLISSEGCDSIATLNLAANLVVTSITDITICNNQLPYNWNGNNYPAAGTYSLTLISSEGCDSIATLNLAANLVVTSITDITICNNQLPYNWNGNNYPAAGIYSVTLISSAGCDSIATLNLAANLVVTSITDITICNNQLPYNWNGNNYPVAGTYSVTLVSAAGCDSIATLHLTTNTVVTSTTAITICNNQFPYAWNGNSYPSAGTYSVTLLSSAGCDSLAILNLAANAVVPGVTDITICNNQLPYNWNGNVYSAAGTYSVTLVSAAGCDSIATLFLTINPVLTSISNTSICSAQLPFNWNGNVYMATGSYTVTLTGSSGCDSLATLNFFVSQTPGLPLVSSPVSYCQYAATVLLSAHSTNGNQLVWYDQPTGGTSTLNTPIPPSTLPGTFNYYVSQVNGACEGPRAVITVTVNSKPLLSDQAITICSGQHADLVSLYDTTALGSAWTTNQLPVINPAAVNVAGEYQLIAANTFGCADTALITLTINPPVTAHAGPDDNAEYNAPYQLQGSGGLHYQWSPATGLSSPFTSNPLAVLTRDQMYILMVKDNAGCFALDTVTLRVLNGPTFYVPSAFTPNSDGLNDVFRPTAVGIASMEYFTIFNRYGEPVYETHDISRGWDGTYQGKKQNPGNYVWKIKGTDRHGKIKAISGNVVLIR